MNNCKQQERRSVDIEVIHTRKAAVSTDGKLTGEVGGETKYPRTGDVYNM